MLNIKENFQQVENKIQNVCQKMGRNPQDIKLITVTKTHPVELIKEALNAGAKFIGENKVQESCDKIPQLQNLYQEFHLIGHLQSNKIRNLMPLKPTLIHSIDKLSTAKKLSDYCCKHDVQQDILIQINTTEEESKSGANDQNAIDLVKQIALLPNIHIKGLMTIGLYATDPEVTRPFFKNLHNIFENIKSQNIANVEMKYLSMGMTHDFEVAIEEGANMIRVGSAIFGARDYSKNK